MIIFLVASIAIAAMTWIAGWWGVVLAALVVGMVQRRRRGIAWIAALSAIIAWGALLLFDATSGRFGALAAVLGGVMRVPAAAVVVVTLLFAALLAWSAAVVGSEIGRAARRVLAPDQG
ncbi:MAG TPA: hypothetical protein VGP25_15480 [Gemmatimonadaceae bacterium]|nr:hypothetical protein [Gemmatimonadaceae bacterium]